MPVFCKDCKFCQDIGLGASFAVCEAAPVPDSTSYLVSGVQEYYSCKSERTPPGRCGISGRHFVARPTDHPS